MLCGRGLSAAPYRVWDLGEAESDDDAMEAMGHDAQEADAPPPTEQFERKTAEFVARYRHPDGARWRPRADQVLRHILKPRDQRNAEDVGDARRRGVRRYDPFSALFRQSAGLLGGFPVNNLLGNGASTPFARRLSPKV